MRELNKQDIKLKNVDTISQYKILEYLKKHLNVDEFKVYLVDRDNIKVVDKLDDELYFSYDPITNEVFYQEELSNDYEIGI